MDYFLRRCVPILLLSRSMRVSRNVRPYLRDLYNRRLIQGPEKYRPRSAWKPWNYDSELLAFSHRIHEKMDVLTLQKCFTDESYANYVNNARSPESKTARIEDNGLLALKGRQVAQTYVTSFLRAQYPSLPEEWVCCISDRLLSDSELAYIGGHLGIGDLVLYSCLPREPGSPLLPENTHPPSLTSLANCFLAVIGAHAEDTKTAHLLVRDFILTRLTELDFCADFDFPMQDDPFPLLKQVLLSQNRGPPEARLQWQCSMNTLLACYQIGIYSDQQLIGEAPGETLEIAEMEAGRQSLRNLFGIHDSRPPLPLTGPYSPPDTSRRNKSLADYGCAWP
ncbi:hypothetical protein AAHC03_05542 [Spirometra sp. Aus1]